MMKFKVLLFFILLGCMNAKADYLPLRIYTMILNADMIVYGEIVALDSSTYTLKVEKDLLGSTKQVQVFRFKNWACAHRWTEYKIGQRLFLFLREHNGRYVALSAGNEGELPISKQDVFVNGRSLNSLPTPFPDSLLLKHPQLADRIPSEYHVIDNGKYYGYKLSLEEFIETVYTIRKCFDHDAEEIVCTEDDLRQKMATDKILEYTFDELWMSYLNRIRRKDFPD